MNGSGVRSVRRLLLQLRTPPFPATARIIVVLFLLFFPIDLSGAGLGIIGMVDIFPYLAASLTVAAVAQISGWRRNEVGKITIDETGLTLPDGVWTKGWREVPFEDLRRVALLRQAGDGALIIETQRRLFSFSLADTQAFNAAETLLSGLRARLTASLDGAQRWDELRRRFAVSRPAFPWVTLALAVILGAAFAIQAFLLPPPTELVLAESGANVPALLWAGDLSVLMTPGLLHLGADHFWGNLLLLLVLGPTVERRLGSCATGCVLATANVIAFIFAAGFYRFQLSTVTVGASGMIVGLVGALLALRLRTGEPSLPGDRVMPSSLWAVWAIFSALLPFFYPTISWSGHIGGLLGGCAATWLLSRLPSAIHRRAAALALACLMAAILVDASALWRPGEIERRQSGVIASIGALDQYNPDSARQDLWKLSASTDLSAEATKAAISLARGFADEDAQRHGAQSTEAAASRLLGISLSSRLSDPQDGDRQTAEAVMDSDVGSNLVPVLLPIFDTLRHRHGPRLVPADAVPPKVTLHVERAKSFTLPLNLAYESPLPHEGRALFLLRRSDDLLGFLKIVIPPGQTESDLEQVIATIDSEIDLTDAEAVPLLYDASSCHCTGKPQLVDARILAVTSPVPPYPWASRAAPAH